MTTLNATQRSRMAEALTLARFLSSHSQEAAPVLVQRRRDRIRAIHQELQSCSHPICRDWLPLSDIPLPVRIAFVRGTLLVSRYSAVGGVGWRGTMMSPTLAKYGHDPIPSTWKTPEGIAAMGDRFALPTEEVVAIKQHLAQVDREINQQRQLMTTVLHTVGLSTNAPDPLPSEPFVALFEKLFSGIRINPDKLSAVFTATQLYFCVDFPVDNDETAWAALTPSSHQAALRQLHCQLSDFSFQQFDRFPTFGPCHPEGIDQQWIQQVCDRLNESSYQHPPMAPEGAIYRLSNSIGVLPRKEAEKYLIHDIWGHCWQNLFGQFKGDYTTLANCGEPLRVHETAYTPQGPLTCRELFHFVDDQVILDSERAQLFFHGEVRQRLGLLFTHLLAELVADIAEFKFIWLNPDAAHELPSSSVFKDYPTNLDLTLADLDFLFLRVLQPLLQLNLSPMTCSPLETELLAALPLKQLVPEQVLCLEVELKRAIAQLHQVFLTEYSTAYLPTPSIEAGLFTSVVENLLHLQNVINTLYTDPQFTQSSTLPFQDLLMVFISSYCSGDRYADFWNVDDVLASYFLPCWHHLRKTA